ncbi:hypothetical protein HAX54_039207 [Datura stramonium]|uniref:Uncharacterized protein n=1 Tax=Datura stramonium TaxID=4076 RepID=A0ABS8VNR1_DATST|nr:hypothetical protein [Datura stramonium]
MVCPDHPRGTSLQCSCRDPKGSKEAIASLSNPRPNVSRGFESGEEEEAVMGQDVCAHVEWDEEYSQDPLSLLQDTPGVYMNDASGSSPSPVGSRDEESDELGDRNDELKLYPNRALILPNDNLLQQSLFCYSETRQKPDYDTWYELYHPSMSDQSWKLQKDILGRSSETGSNHDSGTGSRRIPRSHKKLQKTLKGASHGTKGKHEL